MFRASRRRAVAGLSAAAVVAALPRGTAAQTAAPELEANKAVVRRLFDEVYNGGNLGALDQLLAPEFVGDDPNAAPGVEGYKQTQAAVRAQYERLFRAFAWEMTDVVADGALAFVRMTFTGQQTADGKPDVTTQGFLDTPCRHMLDTWLQSGVAERGVGDAPGSAQALTSSRAKRGGCTAPGGRDLRGA